MAGYRLLAIKGWGSAIVEAAAAVADVALERQEIDLKAGGRERLMRLNPLAQIPTLILPDSRIMTESAAIVLHFADLKPGSALAPPQASAERPMFLRWLVFMVAQIYPTFFIADDPSRLIDGESEQSRLKEGAREHRLKLWRMVEAEAGAPWVLGGCFSALDVYVGVMTRWGPGRDWFKANTPKLHRIALAAESHAALAPVMRANFG